MNERTPYMRMAAALLALLGLFDAVYLSLERVSGGDLFCPVGGGGCATVQSSAYAVIAGVPVAFIGVAGYALLLALALISLHNERVAGLPTSALLLGCASAGLLFTLYLSFVQVALIGTICFWCATSALIELLIWLAALLDWRSARMANGRLAGAGAAAR